MSILVGAGPSDLYDAAADLLAVCADAVASAPGGPIPRMYVSPGPPPWDCVQLTVHSGGMQLADTAPLQPPLQPGVREGANRAVRLVQYTVTVIRCLPVIGNVGPKVPSATAIAQAAQITMSDCWAIWNTVAAAKRDGTLFPPAKTRTMFFDPALALSAEGGMTGWQLGFRVELPGYEGIDS